MDGVIKKTRKGSTANHSSSVDHRRVQKSSTLNRKFVKKPVARPKLSEATASSSRSLSGSQGYSRTILQKGGKVNLRPIQSASAQKQERQDSGRQIKVEEVEKIAVHRASLQSQKQSKRQIVARRIVQKRSGDVYVKNARAVAANQRITAKKIAAQQGGSVKPLTAQQMKDRAIQQALSRMNKIDQAQKSGSKQSMQIQFNEPKEKKAGFFRGRRLAIAAGVAVVVLGVLGYFVYLNMPNLSARVAAMQAGIEKSYPSYVPSSYRLDGLVKEDNGRITMNFKNDQGYKFVLQEEKSSWDSAAVLANYVKKNWGTEYSVAKGQGLTIYISGSNATWVNGGVLYMITDSEGHLSSGDLHDIAVSL